MLSSLGAEHAAVLWQRPAASIYTSEHFGSYGSTESQPGGSGAKLHRGGLVCSLHTWKGLEMETPERGSVR